MVYINEKACNLYLHAVFDIKVNDFFNDYVCEISHLIFEF